ncbi:MAG: DUF4386 family protein [Candidatus Methylomirabilales bacterium]
MRIGEEDPGSLDQSLIRFGGASALLVAVLPWSAALLALPLLLSGYTVLMDTREALLLINSHKLSYAAFLLPFIVAGFAILPVILAVALRFRRASVVLGSVVWGAGVVMIVFATLLSLSLLPLSDHLRAAESVAEQNAIVGTAEAIRWSAQGAFSIFELTFGVAVLIFGWAMLKEVGFPVWLGYLGLGTGIVHLGVAVAEVIPGLDLIFLLDLVFNVWFVGLGAALLRGR